MRKVPPGIQTMLSPHGLRWGASCCKAASMSISVLICSHLLAADAELRCPGQHRHAKTGEPPTHWQKPPRPEQDFSTSWSERMAVIPQSQREPYEQDPV